MGREAKNTYEQVAAMADALKSDGINPTLRAVRERLGNTGSMGTITKHLQTWKASQQRHAEVPLALPPGVQRAMLEYMGQELAAAKASLEAELASLQQEVGDLAGDNERQAADIEALEGAMAAARLEMAALAAVETRLTDELESARGDCDSERVAAGALRVELAKAQLRLEAMPQLESALADARTKWENEHKVRISCEHSEGVAQARHEAAEARADKADAALIAAEQRIAVALLAAEAARTELALALAKPAKPTMRPARQPKR